MRGICSHTISASASTTSTPALRVRRIAVRQLGWRAAQRSSSDRPATWITRVSSSMTLYPPTARATGSTSAPGGTRCGSRSRSGAGRPGAGRACGLHGPAAPRRGTAGARAGGTAPVGGRPGGPARRRRPLGRRARRGSGRIPAPARWRAATGRRGTPSPGETRQARRPRSRHSTVERAGHGRDAGARRRRSEPPYGQARSPTARVGAPALRDHGDHLVQLHGLARAHRQLPAPCPAGGRRPRSPSSSPRRCRRRRPAATSWPDLDQHPQHGALHRGDDLTASPPAPARPPAAVRSRRARAGRRAGPPRAGLRLGQRQRAPRSAGPSTSATKRRSTAGSASGRLVRPAAAPGASRAAGSAWASRPGAASSAWQAPPAMNSSCSSSQRWKGIRVVGPSTTYSSSARIMRRRADSRSTSHTISLATIGS